MVKARGCTTTAAVMACRHVWEELFEANPNLVALGVGPDEGEHGADLFPDRLHQQDSYCFSTGSDKRVPLPGKGIWPQPRESGE